MAMIKSWLQKGVISKSDYAKAERKMVEEYRTNLCNYIRSMTYYKKMLDDELISVEEYSEIELALLKKYQLSPKSLQRMDLKSIAERAKFL